MHFQINFWLKIHTNYALIPNVAKLIFDLWNLGSFSTYHYQTTINKWLQPIATYITLVATSIVPTRNTSLVVFAKPKRQREQWRERLKEEEGMKQHVCYLKAQSRYTFAMV